ncbi:MAG: glycosyltransferase [Bacteroidetes bacterium]|nr:glycosyltransferase [Bacteroidota bacterium]
MSNRLNILFLPRWYPHRYDPMPGLFIQQQAEAVAAECNVAVLYVHADSQAANRYEIDLSEENGVHVVRVYYRLAAERIALIAGFVKIWRFFRAHALGLKVLRSFQPDLVHVHVLTREGVVALWNKILHGTPYVITEHWSRYLPASSSFHGWFRKIITRKVVRSAAAMITVSGTLKEAMQKFRLKNRDWFIIHNPVDTRRFTIGEGHSTGDRKRFIHISCFEDRPKNISGFLVAVKKLAEHRDDFEACLIGDGPEFRMWKARAEEMEIPVTLLSFAGLKEDEYLVNEIQSSDFLVLSSNYETFGTVVIECLSCGIPVVATNVGIVPEVINGDNGIILPPGNQEALENAIDRMLDKCRTYNKQKIREQVASAFSKEKIAGELVKIYSACLRN